jgi:hypothetical protein
MTETLYAHMNKRKKSEVAFLLLGCHSSLYILYKGPLSDIDLQNVSDILWDVMSFFLVVFFELPKLKSLIMFNLYIFSFVAYA